MHLLGTSFVSSSEREGAGFDGAADFTVFLVDGLAIPTLVALVELDTLDILDPALLVPLVTRELALVAADTVLTLIGGGAMSRSVGAMETVRILGVGGVLLLGSIFVFTAGLDGVDDVAEIVRVRTVRPSEGPGLRLLRLTLGDFGFKSGTEGGDGMALGPGLGSL